MFNVSPTKIQSVNQHVTRGYIVSPNNPLLLKRSVRRTKSGPSDEPSKGCYSNNHTEDLKAWNLANYAKAINPPEKLTKDLKELGII